MNALIDIETTATEATLHGIADRLFLAELSGKPIAPLSEGRPTLTVADAYAIQAINVESRKATGAEIVGHKIGLTSKPMQEMLGVDEPDYGHIYSDRTHRSGHEIETAALIAPRIEPELAFVLREDLGGNDVTADDVLAATDYVLPSMEVIDSRIADWKIGLIDTIADNASCAGVVLGETRIDPAELDLTSISVDLLVGEEIVQTGTGDAVLGHPAAAVAWLANALGAFGVTLEAGEVVMSGSITAAVPLEAGARVHADFGEAGDVEVTVR